MGLVRKVTRPVDLDVHRRADCNVRTRHGALALGAVVVVLLPVVAAEEDAFLFGATAVGQLEALFKQGLDVLQGHVNYVCLPVPKHRETRGFLGHFVDHQVLHRCRLGVMAVERLQPCRGLWLKRYELVWPGGHQVLEHPIPALLVEGFLAVGAVGAGEGVEVRLVPHHGELLERDFHRVRIDLDRRFDDCGIIARLVVSALGRHQIGEAPHDVVCGHLAEAPVELDAFLQLDGDFAFVRRHFPRLRQYRRNDIRPHGAGRLEEPFGNAPRAVRGVLAVQPRHGQANPVVDRQRGCFGGALGVRRFRLRHDLGRRSRHDHLFRYDGLDDLFSGHVFLNNHCFSDDDRLDHRFRFATAGSSHEGDQD